MAKFDRLSARFTAFLALSMLALIGQGVVKYLNSPASDAAVPSPALTTDRAGMGDAA